METVSPFESTSFSTGPPLVFAVVGEHREDPDRLLLLGGDGRYYALRLDQEIPVPIELSDEWCMDAPGRGLGPDADEAAGDDHL